MESVFPALAALTGAILSLGFLSYLLVSIGTMRIFREFGVASWKAWIPVVNVALLYKLGDRSMAWIIFYIAYGLTLGSTIGSVNAQTITPAAAGFMTLSILIGGIAGVIQWIIGIVVANRVNQKLGRHGLFIIPAIFDLGLWSVIAGFATKKGSRVEA